MAKSAVHKHQINEFSCGCLTDPCDPCVSSAVYVCSRCLRGYEAVFSHWFTLQKNQKCATVMEITRFAVPHHQMEYLGRRFEDAQCL